MMEFIKKHNIRLAVITFVVAVLSCVYFLVVPLIDKISAKANDIQQRKIDKELNEKKLASISAMEEDFRKFKDNEDRLKITIDQSRELDFIKELEVLAEQTGNRIEFKVDEQTAAKPVAKAKNAEADIKSKLKYADFLSMQIALEGGYTNLMNFINKLENYKNYVNILSISSERKVIEMAAGKSNPFAAAEQVQKNKSNKEVINSILDVVVYIKK